MPTALTTETRPTEIEPPSATFPVLLELPRPLLDYNIVLAINKGDIGAINILKDAINVSRDLRIAKLLLALGPTTPLSLQPPFETRILWATFTDRENQSNSPRLTVVPPNHLTDLSLGLEKLSKTRTGRVRLIVGDFLDNVLSVSSDPAGLYSFVCKLFTRIRTNGQTAFFLITEDMHDSKKTAILKRFADTVIEYSAVEDGPNHGLKARILDHAQNHYSVWESSGNLKTENASRQFASSRVPKVGRRHSLFVQEPVQIHF